MFTPAAVDYNYTYGHSTKKKIMAGLMVYENWTSKNKLYKLGTYIDRHM